MTDKFYNMRVTLINNGKFYTESAAVRNVWEKDTNIFLDIFFHRLKKSFVFDAAFVHDLYDVNRDKTYTDMKKFALEFSFEPHETTPQKSEDTENKTLLDPLKNDASMMLYIARCAHQMTPLKEKIIFEYLQKKTNTEELLSETYLKKYMAALGGTEDDFYVGLNNLRNKSPKEAVELLRTLIKICLSDGHLHYTERSYLADAFQLLRNEGVPLPTDLI